MIKDPRGWGRWAGVRLCGRNGWSMVVLVVYMPCRGGGSEGSMWESQVQQMQRMGLEGDPCMQLRKDMVALLEGEMGRKSHVVVAGDWNMPAVQWHTQTKPD